MEEARILAFELVEACTSMEPIDSPAMLKKVTM
jgi:hypothetical protein